MSSEKFCLKWNDFERNISLSFREIREENDFFDVTLACDDEQIKAHKLILSACSPFFKDVLKKNPHQHPLLYLRGIKFRDIQSILQFMYHGEVNVAQEDLNSFLSISEELKVKGLTQGKSGKSDPGSKANDPPPPPPHRQPAISKKGARAMSERSQFQSPDEDDDIKDVTPIKTEQDVVQGHEISLGDGYDGGHYQEEEANYDYGQYQEEEAGYSVDAAHGNKDIDELIATKMTQIIDDNGRKMWRCIDCCRESQYKKDVARHIEATHIDHPGFECQFCPVLSKTRDSLRHHMKSYHRN